MRIRRTLTASTATAHDVPSQSHVFLAPRVHTGADRQGLARNRGKLWRLGLSCWEQRGLPRQPYISYIESLCSRMGWLWS